MIFRYAILYVNNVPETLTFFEVAFGFKTLFLHEGKDYGELDTGQTKLAFSAISLMDQLGKSPAKGAIPDPAFELAFETEDVASAMSKAINAGAIKVQDPQEMPWGQTTAYVRYEGRFLIEICTAI